MRATTNKFQHPFVGQVEDCNWNMDCVQKWDVVKAEFDKLSPDEQAKKLAIKDALKDAEAAREPPPPTP